MGGREMGRRLLAGVASLCLLAGCGAGASSTPATFGPVTVVTGTARCPGMGWSWTKDADGTWHVRDDYHADRCTLTTDDPRVSGSRSSTWNMDFWGSPSVPSGEVVQWGTARLENDGGAWEGTASGVWSSDRGDIIVNWYTGTGGYQGLGYFELWTGSGPWKIRGQIFPGDPPPPYGETATGTGRPVEGGPVAADAVAVVTGSAMCPGLDFDYTTDADGTQHVREHPAGPCTVTTDDPRVSGSLSATWNIDLWPNPDLWGLVQWGTVRLENEGGAWEGRAAGVASYPERGDILVSWYRGTGDYAGLSYFELQTGFGPWTIQGQIFPGDPPTP